MSLNPVTRIGDAGRRGAAHPRPRRPPQRRDRRRRGARRAGIPDPAARARQYPHELSGGMRQRVLIAIAVAASPRLVIADEPTSALDVTVQRQILDHIAELTTASGAAVLLITHDLGVAAERADRIAVMSGGRIVEVGTPGDVLVRPARRATPGTLIAAAPEPGRPTGHRSSRPRPAGAPTTAGRPIVEARGLVKTFALPGGAGDGVVRAVDDVSLRVERGRTLALVGESGSGKSTTARLLLRLTDPTAGEIRFDGADITTLGGRALRELRRRMQLVYQNPYASLNPRFTVGEVIADPLRSFGARQPPPASPAGRRAPRPRRPAGLGARPQARRAVRRAAPARRHRPRPRRCSPTSSCSTSRSRRSTCRCRPRSSSCSPTCRPTSGSATCSSPTTSPSCARSPTTSPSCTTGASSSRDATADVFAAARRPVHPRPARRHPRPHRIDHHPHPLTRLETPCPTVPSRRAAGIAARRSHAAGRVRQQRRRRRRVQRAATPTATRRPQRRRRDAAPATAAPTAAPAADDDAHGRRHAALRRRQRRRSASTRRAAAAATTRCT